MKDEENTFNLNIDTDKLVTFKDYQKLDLINRQFAELMKHEIVDFVKKQLTEMLGSALTKAINNTLANIYTAKQTEQMQSAGLKDYDQYNKIDRAIRISKNSCIELAMVWHCGHIAQKYANKQGLTLAKLIKTNNYIQKDKTNTITISVNNPTFKKPLDIVICWYIGLSNDGAINIDSPICHINTEISLKFSHQLIKYLVENAGYGYHEFRALN